MKNEEMARLFSEATPYISHTQPCRFAFLGQKARFLCKKGCSFGREPSIIGTIFFKFEV